MWPVGLIPAHAGKTMTDRLPTRPRAAHPRSRGENELIELIGISDQGSSPLTRGKPSQKGMCEMTNGLIPAHAGKTTGRWYRSTCSTAHPRSRGENASRSRKRRRSCGSSPLTRGKPLAFAGALAPLRLIPAHAGKTPRQKRSPRVARAHPRSRGENPDSCKPGASVPGSSPLTRGKHSVSLSGCKIERLIPAHAGKTKRSDHTDPGPSAHPRSRGENLRCAIWSDQGIGSSPLTRGKLGSFLRW